MQLCAVGASRSAFTGSGTQSAAWRQYAQQLLSDVVKSDRMDARLPKWLRSTEADAPLFVALDAALERKRIPCAQKLGQIEAMLAALKGKLPLSGAPMTPAVDVDGIFLMEKREKSYVPEDRRWLAASRTGGPGVLSKAWREPRHRAGSVGIATHDSNDEAAGGLLRSYRVVARHAPCDVGSGSGGWLGVLAAGLGPRATAGAPAAYSTVHYANVCIYISTRACACGCGRHCRKGTKTMRVLLTHAFSCTLEGRDTGSTASRVSDTASFTGPACPSVERTFGLGHRGAAMG